MFKISIVKSPNNFLRKKFLFLLSFVFVCYFWLITYGTGNLINYETQWLGCVYDNLAKHLMQGTPEVDNELINWEAFIRNGKSYTYLGAFPALIRIVPNTLFPSLYGHFSRTSCLIASLLCILAFSFILNKQLIGNSKLSEKDKNFYFFISVLCFAFGSPLFLLTSSDIIFHEAMLWGFCWSLFGIYFLICLLKNNTEDYFHLLGFSFCCGFALLSRITFGLPLYVILILYVFKMLIRDINRSAIRSLLLPRLFKKIFAVAVPALLALSFQFWYNYERFGSITNFDGFKYYYPVVSSNDLQRHLEHGLFNLHRIPSSLINYFGVKAEYFSPKAPYIIQAPVFLFDPSIFSYNSSTISITIASPWIILGAIIGWFLLISKKKQNIFIVLCAVVLMLQGFLTAAFEGIVDRYSTEFFPFLIFLYSYYLAWLGEQKRYEIIGTTLKNITKIFCIFSVTATVLSTFSAHYYSWRGAPSFYTNNLKVFFQFIDFIAAQIFKIWN